MNEDYFGNIIHIGVILSLLLYCWIALINPGIRSSSDPLSIDSE